jgi:multidrug efflux pump subunit AcrB
MNLTQVSLKNPAALAVAVALLVLFGLLAVLGRPLQLLPVMTQPQISVFNNWREAAPEEMESYIVEPQEQVLRRTPGVTEISSNVSRGQGGITLSFEVGTDMQQALINVINNLNQTPPLPVDAGEPFVAGGGGQNLPNVASLQIYPLKGNPNQDMFSEEYQRVIDNIVEPRLNQIPGVARVNMAGRRPFEVSITFDPYRAAALGIPISAIASTVSRANDMSGGFSDVGRRQYTVRFLGQYEIDKLGEMIVAWIGERPIHLNEVAEIEKVNVPPFGINIRNGYPAYYILLQSASDGNTVDILDHVNEAISDLNKNALTDVGLIMELSFDASVYIRRAISLVKNNLGLGVMLAVGVLWFFLRDRRATLIIAASIPVSLLAAFIGLQVFDLTLNVISLAGLAFSVGLVLDAAIIVQENIVRYRQQGEKLVSAVLHGTNQVKGALFASTMTTVAIFLPILFLEGQEGQMFSDLALTLSISVLASLVAALTLIPVASSLWLKNMKNSDPFEHWWDGVTRLVMNLTKTGARRLTWVIGLIVLSLGLAWGLMPKADFLPSAKADAVTVFFNTPPGVTNDLFEKEIGAEIIKRLKPHMDHEKNPSSKATTCRCLAHSTFSIFTP